MKLIVRKCRVTGELGFVPETSETFFDNSDSYIVGVAIGHELIDHTPNEIGTLEDELAALGCIIWRGGYSVAMNGFKGDLQNTFLDAARLGNSAFGAADCPHDVEISDEVLYYISQMWDELEEALQKYPEDFGIEDTNTQNLDNLWNRANLEKWISYGYNQAKIRYKAFDSDSINQTVQAIDLACRNEAGAILWDGQAFELEFDILNCWASVTECNLDED